MICIDMEKAYDRVYNMASLFLFKWYIYIIKDVYNGGVALVWNKPAQEAV